MYLFTRTLTARGNPRDVTNWALELTAHVNEKTDLNVALWQGLFGGPVGSLSWSSLVQSRSALLASNASLMGDDKYFELIERASDWVTTPPEDRFCSILHTGGGEYRRMGTGSVATITAATAHVASIQKAMEFGVRISDLVAGIIGVPVMFATVEHGGFGELQWTSVQADMADTDTAAEALAKDADYLSEVQKAGDLFVPGSGRQALGLRLA